MECDQQLAYLHGYSSSDELVNMNVKQLIPSLVLPTSGQVIDKVRNGLQAWVTLQYVVVMIALYLVSFANVCRSLCGLVLHCVS